MSLRPHEINRRAGSGFPEPAFSCRSGGLVQRSDGSSGAAFRRAFSRMRVSPLRVSGVRPQRASNGGAFSNYYHGSKYHSSTVVSRWTSKSSKAYAYAGQTSYAFIKTSFGEQAAFYYNYN